MEDGFVPGASVKSNELYFKEHTRRITGYVISPRGMDLLDTQVIIRWVSQTGEGFNPALDKQMILMSKKHLILV